MYMVSINTNQHFHPKANDWLEFIVEFDSVRVYHTGYSDYMPEMNQIKTDIARLPVSGTYMMTATEAVAAALAIASKLAIQMHIGAIIDSKQNARSFKNGLKGKVEVAILSKE